MKYKRILLIVLTLNCVLPAFSQSDHLNLKKYWFYRYRLLNNFMAKGPNCQGCSEILNERGHIDDRVTDPTPTFIAKWGDQSFNLGEYISILATEYKLLSDRGQPTDTTLQELCYAFRAFNRLDLTAEHYYGLSKGINHPITTDDFNGFWIRDDVPSSFLDDHDFLKAGILSEHPVEFVDSDYKNAIDQAPNYGINPDDKNFLMSHDQIYPILMGMALVRRYLYDGANYNNYPLNDVDFNSNIYEEAKNITDRIINNLDHPLDIADWTLTNPLFSPTTTSFSNPILTPVDDMQGYQARQLSYPIAETGCYIQNPNSPPGGTPIHTCNTYHDNSSFDEAAFWNDAGRHYPIPGIGYEEFKVEINAALSNSWWTSMFPTVVQPAGVLGMFENLEWPPSWGDILSVFEASIGIPVNVTEGELANRADSESNQYLPLLRKLLYGGGNPIPEGLYRSLLNTAPCNGPFNFSGSGGGMSTYEWSSRDRLHVADERGGYVGSEYGSSQGEYPGLDYMLYYNLTALEYGPGTSYVNYMDRKIGFVFPYTIPSVGPLGGSVEFSGPPGLTVGNSVHPVTIEAFHTIDANNLLLSDAVIDYRAGKQIHLGPGFHATSGCTFHAYIDPFECASDGEYRASTTNSGNNNTNMATAVAYNGPTSFVNYPNRATSLEYVSNTEPSLSQPTYTQQTQGTYSSSNISPQKPIDEPEINIYPNPNSGSFTVLFLREEEATSTKIITISNIYGRTIFEQQTTNAIITIDITDQSKGIYYVKIENQGKTKMQKIVYQ